MAGTTSVAYERLRVELGIGLRVKSQVAAWKALQDDGYIEPANGKDFQLTQKGLDFAATPEYTAYIKDLNIVSLTNEDHQARIKKHLCEKHRKRGVEIFDHLAKHGSLTANELAALVGTKRGTHKFSYALKELKDKGYVEIDSAPTRKVKGKLLRLSDRAFLKPEDRVETEAIDTDMLTKALKDNAARKRGGDSEEEKASDARKRAKGPGAKNDKKNMVEKDGAVDSVEENGEIDLSRSTTPEPTLSASSSKIKAEVKVKEETKVKEQPQETNVEDLVKDEQS